MHIITHFVLLYHIFNELQYVHSIFISNSQKQMITLASILILLTYSFMFSSDCMDTHGYVAVYRFLGSVL